MMLCRNLKFRNNYKYRNEKSDCIRFECVALLAACSRSSVLKIVEQGSFAVGGTVLTDSLGRYLSWRPCIRVLSEAG